MAKESSSSTRIPRLDGGTRIPLPGTFRPPPPSTAASLLSARASQILRPPSGAFGQQRPVSLSGLRPPSLVESSNLLKRSSSGDRITNAVNLVSKKTTAAFQKFIGSSTSRLEKVKPFVNRKPVGSAKSVDANQTKAADVTTTIAVGTPRPQLTRSETFVRGDSQLDMLGVTQNLTMAPDTPAPVVGKRMATFGRKGTQLGMVSSTPQVAKQEPLNATHIVGGQPMSDTITIDQKEQTMTVDWRRSTFGKTMDMSTGDHPMGCTMTMSAPEVTQHILSSTVNLTKTFDAVLGQTMDVAPPPLGSTMAFVNTFVNETMKNDMEEGRAETPATNATYSNPGSTDNLQLLEDVSIPPEFDADDTLKPVQSCKDLLEFSQLAPGNDDTLIAGAPDKATMNLPLNSTMNTERLLDISTASLLSSPKHMKLLNLTKDFGTPNDRNTTQLLYMTQISSSATTTPDGMSKFYKGSFQHTPMPAHLMSPMRLTGARSDLVLPTRTPTDDADGDGAGEPMDVDCNITAIGARTEHFLSHHVGVGVSLQDVNNPNVKQKSRFSFGLDLTESTLDCSIELVDVSLSSTGQSQPNHSSCNKSGASIAQSPTTHQLMQQQLLKKQNSFDLDESLGILTPDQMKEFLDSTTTNNTNNLDLPLALNANCSNSNKLAFHQMRIDQTPSPEELPLDPVEVKTDISDMVLSNQMHQLQRGDAHPNQPNNQLQPSCGDLKQPLQSNSTSVAETISTHTDTDVSKADTMTKSSVSKISTSFITSVTSVTSLDTGYQGDGEMSRPASRGAGDHSPSNGPAVRKGGHVSRQPSFNQQPYAMPAPLPPPPVRRQDPMTDSDFFTESDADDIFHRGDRRAQVIDGQLYGPMLQPGSASVFISEDPQMEDSCMESSGIFTDVENRCDEDLAQMRRRDDGQEPTDMSPDNEDSTETVKSNRKAANDSTKAQGQGHHQSHKSNSQSSSSLLHNSFSADRLSTTDTLSNRTSYCSVGSAVMNMDYKSFSSLEEACCGESGEASERRLLKSSGVAQINTGSSSSCCGENGHADRSGSGDDGDNDDVEFSSTNARSVRKVSSPRKHASLTSLCCNANVNTRSSGVYRVSTTNSDNNSPVLCANGKVNNNNNNNNNLKRSEKKCPQSLKSPAVSLNKSASPKYRLLKSPNAPAISGGGHVPRKSHSPNKWDAVMNKIANNKVNAIKKNYNEVKSKVFSPRSPSNVNGGSPVSVSGSASRTGSGGALTPRSSSTSPSTNTSSIRRSPSSSVTNKVSAKSPSPSPQANKQRVATSAGLAAVRGRSYSKDSQKSSQSDLSLTSATANGSVCSSIANGGCGGVGGNASPKLMAKTPLRAAKKRDVRNLSISPTDLGPPPKTQQTAKGASSRPKPASVSLTHKRLVPTASQSVSGTSTAAGTPTGSSSGSVKNSPIAKKHTILTRRFDKTSSSSTKSPLKDHNRIVDSSQSQPQQQLSITKPNAVSKPDDTNVEAFNDAAAANGETADVGSIVAIHQQQQQQLIINNNNNSSNSLNKNNTRNNLSSPILGNAGGRNAIARRTPVDSSGAVVVAATTSNGQPPEKRNNSPKAPTNANANKLRPQQSMEVSSAAGSCATPSEYLDATELRQLKLLNRHSCNGRLDYAALERHLQRTEMVEQHQGKSVEALGVLLQYLVHDLDAFACPMAKKESAKAKDSLSKTLHLLEEAKSNCTELQDQLCDKEAYFNKREEELQTMHRCELERVKTEFQMLAKQQISAVEAKLAAKDDELQRSLDCYRMEMEHKFAQKEQQLKQAEERERELKERLSAAESAEQSLRDRLAETQTSYLARLQDAEEREYSLNERVQLISREMEEMKASKESLERELREKLHLSQDEVSVLRTTRRSMNECNADRNHSPRHVSNSSLALELDRHRNEANSLRCVLEMKQTEFSKLSKHNEELMRDAEQRLALQNKLSLLESANELLKTELQIKTEKEHELQQKLDTLHKAFDHESTKRTRLSFDNEALQWQLKNRSAQLLIVEGKLQELSGQDSMLLNASTANNSSLSFKSSQNTLASMMDSTDGGCGSPPSSPLIKAVIEKPDSVSWVLEMDDESPESAATKMVKRAGSFRTVERSPSMRRQLSMSASAAYSSSSPMGGPNPLSQSMSATSVIRQHSNDVSMESAKRSHSRMRSKSMSVKTSDLPAPSSSPTLSSKTCNKLTRQQSATHSRKSDLVASTWKEPISSSSPYNAMRPRSSTINRDTECADSLMFRRPSAVSGTTTTPAGVPRKLITCDTSTLNSGEKLEMRSLPTHPSVHDLKVLKKCQEIQESAGEAMLSGTNSEDEGCSASSDDIISTTSTTSGTGTGSTSSLNHLKNNHMSLEEVLQIEKMNSLSCTPMEMSWSDDADAVFATTSSTV